MPYSYRSYCSRVIDGDSMVFEIDLGFRLSIKKTIRVLDLDTPETFRPKSDKEKEHGEQAKKVANELLLHKFVTLRTEKDRNGYYGRLLASIELPDGRDYTTVMKKLGYQKKAVY